MNLHQSIRTVRTIKLFEKKFKYKIVLKTPVAHWFRSNDLANVKNKLKLLKETGKLPYKEEDRLRNLDDTKYVQQLVNLLSKFSDYKLRVQLPYVTIYTNSQKNIESLASIDVKNVKYISLPKEGSLLLESNKIVLKRLDYAFKINLKGTTQEFNNFITWAENNSKIRLTKRVKKDLTSEYSVGGGYFYVKDDKTLSMVRLFIGPCIRSVETVVKL